MKIYLDDERKCPDGWTLTKNVKETIKLLKNNDVEKISLDHDLGLENGNGYDVLLWIEQQVFLHDYKPPKILIHTANPSARIKMKLARKRLTR